MDFRQVILESLIEKLISQRIDELSADTLTSYISRAERSGPHPKGSNRRVGIAKARYKLGKKGSNNPRSVFGSNSKGSEEAKQKLHHDDERGAPMPLSTIHTMGTRSDKEREDRDARATAIGIQVGRKLAKIPVGKM